MSELVDRVRLRADVEHLAKTFRQDPQAGRVRRRVSTHLVRDVLTESNFIQYGKHFRFQSDESKDRAGQGLAPSPLRYFLSGVAFCLQAWTAKATAVLDCPLTSLEIDVEAYMDQCGQYEAPDVPVEPQWLLVESRTEGPAADALVRECLEFGFRHCPVSMLVAKAVPIFRRSYHNGTLVADVDPTAIPSGAKAGTIADPTVRHDG